MGKEPDPPPLHPRFDFAGLFLPSRKTLVVLLAVLAGLGLAGYAGWTVLKKRHEKSASRLAVAALESGRYHEALLWARRALSFNPQNPAALDVMCQIGSLPGLDPVPWMRQALAVEPASFPRFRSLVLALMGQRRFDEAGRLFDKVPAGFETLAEFYSLKGTLALARGHFPSALEAYEKAAALDPASAGYRLNLLSARLHSADTREAEDAGRSLWQWRDPAELRPRALANLLSYRLVKQPARVPETLDALVDCPEASLGEKLGFLSRCAPPGADRAAVVTPGRLDGLRRQASESAIGVYQLASALQRLGCYREAGDFLASLPEEMRRQPDVVVARAEALILEHNGKALAALSAAEDWGKYASIRRLVEIHLEEEAGGVLPGGRGTSRAAGLADSLRENPRELSSLIDLAGFWGWERLEIVLLESASKNPLLQKDARIKLYRLYRAGGSTPGLYDLMKAQALDDPEDRVAQNNLTCLGLLLGINPPAQHSRALEYHQKHPGDPAGTSTLALSHMLRGEFAHAHALLAALPAETLNESGTALYYAWSLAGLKREDEARQVLARVDRSKLLPEERGIFDRVAAGNNSGAVP